MSFADDRKTIVEILQFIERLLEELIPQLQEDRQLFQSAWFNEVQPILRQLIADINNIFDESDARWEEFKRRGLEGDQLKLKRARLAAASKKGLRKKILDIINSILGSIPGADPIKEFKELTEEGLEDIPDVPPANTFL